MRGGYPVRVSHVTQCMKIPGYVDPDHMFPKGWKPVEDYWQVTSTKLIGNCGHKHATEEAAQECLEPMTVKYREVRWGKKVTP